MRSLQSKYEGGNCSCKARVLECEDRCLELQDAAAHWKSNT